jgi:hypothetical protein
VLFGIVQKIFADSNVVKKMSMIEAEFHLSKIG